MGMVVFTIVFRNSVTNLKINFFIIRNSSSVCCCCCCCCDIKTYFRYRDDYKLPFFHFLIFYTVMNDRKRQVYYYVVVKWLASPQVNNYAVHWIFDINRTNKQKLTRGISSDNSWLNRNQMIIKYPVSSEIIKSR